MRYARPDLSSRVRVPGVPRAPDCAPFGPARYFLVRDVLVSLGQAPGSPYHCANWGAEGLTRREDLSPGKDWKEVPEAQWRDLLAATRLGW